jgi:hypothetical protein
MCKKCSSVPPELEQRTQHLRRIGVVFDDEDVTLSHIDDSAAV